MWFTYLCVSPEEKFLDLLACKGLKFFSNSQLPELKHYHYAVAVPQRILLFYLLSNERTMRILSIKRPRAMLYILTYKFFNNEEQARDSNRVVK